MRKVFTNVLKNSIILIGCQHEGDCGEGSGQDGSGSGDGQAGSGSGDGQEGSGSGEKMSKNI